MTIDPKAQFAGLSLVEIRNFLNRFSLNPIDVERVQSTFRVSSKKASSLIAALEREGYITKADKTPYAQYWTLTDAGSRLASAYAARPISRKTAEKKLAELIKRAKRVNRSDDFAFCVSQIAVVGSYLSDAPTMSDVDVVVSLRPRLSVPQAQQTLENKCINASHRRFSNLVDRIYWPRQQVMFFLKSRSRALQCVGENRDFLSDCPKRIIFEDRIHA
jgi:predicted nucleotidyltransferase